MVVLALVVVVAVVVVVVVVVVVIVVDFVRPASAAGEPCLEDVDDL